MTIKKMTSISIMAALTCVLTMFPQIPVPATEGFIHLGDTMIFIAAAIFGPVGAALSAGIGSMLADILSGYMHWAIPTLIIKSIMGFTAGYVLHSFKLNGKEFTLTILKEIKISKQIIAFGIGGVIMLVGYYIAGAILKGSWVVPLASVPFNVIQFITGTIAAISVIRILSANTVPKSVK